MQQPKNEPNANPIRTLKKSRVISTGKLSKIRLYRRPQRGFTGDHRDHKGRIQKAKTGDCRAAAIRNQSSIAVGYIRCRTGTETNISRKNKTRQASRRYQFSSRLADPAFAGFVSPYRSRFREICFVPAIPLFTRTVSLCDLRDLLFKFFLCELMFNCARMAPRRSNPTALDSFVIDYSGERPQVRTWTSPSNAQSGETLSGARESPATRPFAPSRAGKL